VDHDHDKAFETTKMLLCRAKHLVPDELVGRITASGTP